ncbi:MAG: hypothetical protein C0600_13460 [Ignavibacteria bacterium]|nr:MAG: hypothetical protein C0600_13460 [Ignavibacteria bacterium]
MRFVTPLLIGLFAFVTLHAQSTDENVWLEDDFTQEALGSQWTTVSGTWSVDGERAKVVGGGERFAMLYDKYVMYSKPFVIEAVVSALGGGVVFNTEHKDKLMNSHVVRLVEGGVTLGYMDFMGEYFETRAIAIKDLAAPVTLRVYVDIKNGSFSVLVNERNVALEELRFNSGYCGLYAGNGHVTFDRFRLLGEGSMDTPGFFIKSNRRQLDNLSYMAHRDDGLLIVSPVIGIAQRITSVGTYVSEISVDDENVCFRGIAADSEHSYVVDAAAKALRVFDTQDRIQKVITADLEDPRDVAVDDSRIYVLDKSGIVVFDKQLNSLGRKAAGLFLDPKGLTVHGDKIYVADFGNGQVQVLDKSGFDVDQVIKDQLLKPWGVAVDPSNGDIYVADPGAVAVLHYDDGGGFVERIDPITIRGFISPRAVLVLGSMIYVGDFDRILGFKKGVLTIRPSLRIN